MGPADDEPCPCGSARSTASCHFNPATHRWQLPAFVPLLSGARTGSSVSGCYTALTNDCKGKLSSEHWLSKGVLAEVSDGKFVRIGGLPWQPPGRIDNLPPNSLGSNVLCERHNNALWPLEADCAHARTILDQFFLDQISHKDIGGSQFDLVSGEQLERWLLKTIWGATAAFPTVPQIRGNVDRAVLADYLFREGILPPSWGLYTKGLQTGRRSDPEHTVSVRLEDIDGECWGGSMVVGGVELYFSFGSLTGGGGATVVYRPSAIFLDRVGTDNCKVVALSWDHNTTSVAQAVRVTYGQGPGLSPG